MPETPHRSESRCRAGTRDGRGGGIGELRVDPDQLLVTTLDVVSRTGSGHVVRRMLERAGDMRVYVADGEVESSPTRRPRPNGCRWPTPSFGWTKRMFDAL